MDRGCSSRDFCVVEMELNEKDIDLILSIIAWLCAGVVVEGFLCRRRKGTLRLGHALAIVTVLWPICGAIYLVILWKEYRNEDRHY